MVVHFEHRHFAHCESGVLSGLLKSEGVELSEPMVFGVGGALSFAFLPFLKIGNLPAVSYRMFPGALIRSVPPKMGIRFFARRYRSPAQAMQELDSRLEQGKVAALQTGAYFTTYFPPEMRFQFNGHNIIVYGKEGNEYLISDPVFDHTVRMSAADLARARFSKGLGAPRGFMYYPESAHRAGDSVRHIAPAIGWTVRMMLHAPLPFIGIKGICLLARTIKRLEAHPDQRFARHFLGNIVRMQEEIGTGGGGFRFMYAAFLQESAGLLGSDLLAQGSMLMAASGDNWRAFAAQCARTIKARGEKSDFASCADALRGCARSEQEVYRLLEGWHPVRKALR